jgi:hypothetical protein
MLVFASGGHAEFYLRRRDPMSADPSQAPVVGWARDQSLCSPRPERASTRYRQRVIAERGTVGLRLTCSYFIYRQPTFRPSRRSTR